MYFLNKNKDLSRDFSVMIGTWVVLKRTVDNNNDVLITWVTIFIWFNKQAVVIWLLLAWLILRKISNETTKDALENTDP